MRILRRILPIILGMLFVVACEAPKPDSGTTESPTETEAEDSTREAITYDAELAAKLGADDYGMRTYVMAFLKAGPNRSQDSLEAARLQQAHLDNIQRMSDMGKLILAGPFMDGGEVRGIYIFDVPTIEEARALTETDPAIQAGRLEMELRPWYGSAALLELQGVHRRIQKTDF